jgi:hypothetical protein
VLAVEIGVHVADRDRLDAGRLEPGRQRLHRRLVERDQHVAAAVHALGMPKRRSRGTSGDGFTMKMSYCSKRCSKAISIESRKPSVTTSAVLAPLRSMMALVASVVPWMIDAEIAGLGARQLQDLGHAGQHAFLGRARRGQHLHARALAVPFEEQVGEGAADIDCQTCFFHDVLCRRLLDVSAEIGLPDARIGAHLGRRAFHEESACSMTSARSEISSAPRTFCSTTRTVTPLDAICCTLVNTSPCMRGDRPSEGSSSSSRSGSSSSTIAISRICCSPPDRLPAAVRHFGCRSGRGR